MSLADRAMQIAAQARDRAANPGPERDYVTREWWLVNNPGQGTIEVFMCPAQTQEFMDKLYAGCKVEPK